MIKAILTILLFVPIAALLHTILGRNATAQAGHVVELVAMAGMVTWMVWVTIAVLWLIWTAHT